MIRSFACADTEALFTTGRTRRWPDIKQVAERKLAALDAANELRDLRSPPGNRLHSLEGDRRGQHSISINMQWRICFTWTESGPENVEIVDYH
ncbi:MULTISPECIES: type II toxin-antitoxin system RelE/ParE family toxin [Pseudomonas]|uniref:Type II toxin-antitoxin system RelE/ParE family toxin n=1 Tax=Pseudomonas coleopterorum TaxID=1605838 RepID=A0ABR9BYF4_9PSED|nr:MULTISPECIES: type II toxin-antitoxin system RelE/ParE family toxin [Pseudomonas]MBD8755405.1 type II toxin-antitoxin system RelE/ParE family toxin [Pseudomonas coleopterorum]MBD8770138.1 type II toxin-antitoxin system RelE/ParE family toxin [Pseudomonas coleopterorum]